jgi:hypothetical protein
VKVNPEEQFQIHVARNAMATLTSSAADIDNVNVLRFSSIVIYSFAFSLFFIEHLLSAFSVDDSDSSSKQQEEKGKEATSELG